MKIFKKLMLAIVLMTVAVLATSALAVPLDSLELDLTKPEFKGFPEQKVTANFELTYTGEYVCGIKSISHTLDSEFNAKFPKGIIGTNLKPGQTKTFSMEITIPNSNTPGNYPALGVINLEAYEVASPFGAPEILTTSTPISLEVWNPTQNVDSEYLEVSSVSFTGYETVSASFTIKNPTTAYKIKDIILKTTLGTAYDVKFTDKPSEILHGETKTINMEITIPNDLAVGAHDIIGKLIVEAGVYRGSDSAPGGEERFSLATETANINIEKTEKPTQKAEFTVSEITLGGDTQNRGEYDTKTITITNTGTEELTNLEFSSTADADYKITFEDKPTSALASGASATATVKGFIPLHFDSGSRSIGSIEVKAAHSEGDKIVTSDLKMQAPSTIAIEKIKIDCNGKTSTIKENDVVDENIAPGDVCSIEATISNTHDTTDFDEIEVELDGDSELEGDSNTASIDAGEEETITLELTIDEDAEGEEYDAYIKAEGDDENGANHKAEVNFKIKIEKAEHEILIKNVRIKPREVDLCQATEVNLEITLYNNGEKKEKDAGLEIRVPGLSYVKIVEDIVIDDGEEFIVRAAIPITKATYAGNYNIILTALYDDVKQSDTETETFTILEGCPSQTTLPPTNPDGNEGISAAQNTSKFDSVLTVILLLANLAVATTLGILGFKLFKDLKKMKK